MRGAARLCWPDLDRTDERSPAPPFASGGATWADWIARLHADDADATFDALNDLGLGPLVVVVSTAHDDPDDDDVQWATPDRLLGAAQLAHELLITKDARFAPIFALYGKAAGAGSADAARERMAQDLLDVAAMAQWALTHAKTYVAMDLD
jgi:hypothetical protein